MCRYCLRQRLPDHCSVSSSPCKKSFTTGFELHQPFARQSANAGPGLQRRGERRLNSVSRSSLPLFRSVTSSRAAHVTTILHGRLNLPDFVRTTYQALQGHTVISISGMRSVSLYLGRIDGNSQVSRLHRQSFSLGQQEKSRSLRIPRTDLSREGFRRGYEDRETS